MTRIFECERCKKTYRNNKNELMKKYASHPYLVLAQSSHVGYIKLYSSNYEHESEHINLCDECMIELDNFLSNKEE